MNELASFLARAERVLERVERLLPADAQAPDWKAAKAFRWRRRDGRGWLQPVSQPHTIRLKDLCDIDEQKELVERNTRQFVEGRFANNVLLTGARGTGKSSLVKGVLNAYAKKGLRLIEVDKDDLVDLPDIIELVHGRPERFIVFCDDMSFEEAEPGYKALKSVLDGSIAALPDNVLIYATSNRRHLMPEYHDENLQARHVGGEIHPGEAVEEKVSLSERFGLWISFYPFSQAEYLTIVGHWLKAFGMDRKAIEAARPEALQWALQRGSRSGRVAWQFARDHAGRAGLV
ncbi:ATP-binding protein [Pseudazoarcus pumilus]|uniref:AAA family ATPase n=1 Tax=Pseudazoarcus pumilus TaxID=2067960 RepID=A0A2I6S4V9_9RHOO|nr:ATP-binding protein [Pseudazoarcus pumilus]AUN94294.1 AAA family ATPase [Pseudazoarcus pumilus]